MNRNDKQTIIFGLLGACMVIVLLTLVIILGSIIVNGLPMLSWDFLTQSPEIDDTGAQTEGGIWGPLVGTFYLMLLVLGIAIPVGVLGTIFLVEYLGKYSWNRILWIVINNLAGVPSIVYGLLGVALFVGYMQFGLSLIAAGLTLGLMVLPVTMVATREALEAVPQSLRDASIALGGHTLADHEAPHRPLFHVRGAHRRDPVPVPGRRRDRTHTGDRRGGHRRHTELPTWTRSRPCPITSTSW